MLNVFIFCLLLTGLAFIALVFMSRWVGDLLDMLRGFRDHVACIGNALYEQNEQLTRLPKRAQPEREVTICGYLQVGASRMPWAITRRQRGEFRIDVQYPGTLFIRGCKGQGLTVSGFRVGQNCLNAFPCRMPVEALNWSSGIEVDPTCSVWIELEES